MYLYLVWNVNVIIVCRASKKDFNNNFFFPLLKPEHFLTIHRLGYIVLGKSSPTQDGKANVLVKALPGLTSFKFWGGALTSGLLFWWVGMAVCVLHVWYDILCPYSISVKLFLLFKNKTYVCKRAVELPSTCFKMP